MSEFKAGDIIVLKEETVKKITDSKIRSMFDIFTIGKPYTVFEVDGMPAIKTNDGSIVKATISWFRIMTPEEVAIATILFFLKFFKLNPISY